MIRSVFMLLICISAGYGQQWAINPPWIPGSDVISNITLSGTVFYLSGDNETNSTIGNYATNVNDLATYPTGKIGKCIQLNPNATTVNFISSPFTSQITDSSNVVTVETWVYDRGTNIDSCIWSLGYPTFSPGGTSPGVYTVNQRSGNNYISCLRPASASQQCDSTGVTPNEVTNWYHIAVVYYSLDGGGSADRYIKTYVNGVLRNTTTAIDLGFGNAIVWGTSKNVKLGSISGDLSATKFYGSLDEFAVYNRELTPREIRGIYQSGIVGGTVTRTAAP